jgi:ribulose 1,5-bisphosphate synthetase/thiazole synthase
MGKPTNDRTTQKVNRRNFLSRSAAGVGAVAMAGAGAREASAQANGSVRWDYTVDVVVIGAGVAGLPAAITARDNGASVIIVEENYDIGGRGMLSGGRVQVGGGHALQQKLGIKDTADQIFLDWVRYDHPESKLSDRDLVRVFADEHVATYDFLIDNGVEFIEKPIRSPDASTVDRIFVTKEWHIPSQVIAPRRSRNGSGLVRRLEESARKKGVQIFLKHKMTSIVREKHNSGRVLGITAVNGSNPVNIRATKGVIVSTGGHSGNVNFRRTFDPRLTEEYQQAGMPFSFQGADGELAAMDIGASLWSTGNQTNETGASITKTRHIGCRWGYSSLVYEPDSVMFPHARATGLTVKDWQNLIMVNQFGQRFWKRFVVREKC